MEDSERRQNTRVAFTATVDVDFSEQKFSGCASQDLSVKGVFLAGVRNQALGDRCDLTLSLSGTSSELCLRIKGEVVRVEKDGVALRFHEMDLDSYYHLKNIIYYNAEDPDDITEKLMD
jgi:hypothetical protein